MDRQARKLANRSNQDDRYRSMDCTVTHTESALSVYVDYTFMESYQYTNIYIVHTHKIQMSQLQFTSL